VVVCTGHDGLSDDVVAPGDGHALIVQSDLDVVDIEWPIITALQIIFTGPDHFYKFILTGFCDMDGFADEIGGSCGSAAEGAAEEDDIHFYLLW